MTVPQGSGRPASFAYLTQLANRDFTGVGDMAWEASFGSNTLDTDLTSVTLTPGANYKCTLNLRGTAFDGATDEIVFQVVDSTNAPINETLVILRPLNAADQLTNKGSLVLLLSQTNAQDVFDIKVRVTTFTSADTISVTGEWLVEKLV